MALAKQEKLLSKYSTALRIQLVVGVAGLLKFQRQNRRFWPLKSYNVQ